MSRVSAFLTPRLTLLKRALSGSDADNGRELSDSFPYVFWPWAVSEGIVDEEPEDIWGAFDQVAEITKDDKVASQFLNFAENSREIRETSEGPPFLYMSYTKPIRDEWLIHFTSDAHGIAKNGFKYGVDVLDRLALSTSFTHESKKNGGYNFAFRLQDFKRHGKGNFGRGWKYGDEAVVFQANGILVYHYGDEEPQVIIDGKTARNIIPIIENDQGWTVESVKTGERVYSDDNLDKVTDWIARNFAQYRKPLMGASDGIEREVLSTEQFPDRGYEVRKEIWTIDPNSGSTEMTSAYSLHDDSYIGESDHANNLWSKYGITHWESPYDSDSNVCAMGFSPEDDKWYGWSHRAIFGFGVGHKVKKGDSGTEYLGPGSGGLRVGTKVRDLDEAKQLAVNFAKCVATTNALKGAVATLSPRLPLPRCRRRISIL